MPEAAISGLDGSPLRNVLGGLPPKSLALFGSMARDEANLKSDVDLLVEFEYPVGLFEFIGLQQYLETLLGCRVDLGTPRSLKPHLKDSVLREAILVTWNLD